MTAARARLATASTVVVLASLVAAVGPVTAVMAQDAGSQKVFQLADPVSFESPPGAVMQTATGRYLETLEVRRAPLGDLLLINDIDIETYVAGIAEMPARWPLEALKAQAVAARTYAWFQTRLGTFQRRGFGYDICATTACQVFRGHAVVETPLVGNRWQRAVDETAGQVLTFEGAPILARYSSTNGGRIFANEEVFTSEGPRPYLLAGEDPDDAVSPLHTWTVHFTRAELDTILARGDTLSAAVPTAKIETIPDEIEGKTKSVVVTGIDGTRVEVSSIAFRDFISRFAPAEFPDKYPGPRDNGEGSLPTAIPSTRYVAEDLGDEVVLHGRGWGHGVGLGQYGAKGKAERGLDHDEILAVYYGGLTPTVDPDLPKRIRVGLRATSEPISVTIDAPSILTSGGAVVAEGALGTWVVDGPGTGLRVTAPMGFGEPLETSAVTVSRTSPSEVEVVRVSVRTNKPTIARLVVRAADGRTVVNRPLGVADAGMRIVPWSLDDDAGRPLPQGRYDVDLVVDDGVEESRSDPVAVTIRPFAGAGGLILSAAVLPDPAVMTAAGRGILELVGAGAVVGLVLGLLVPVGRRRDRW